MKVKKWVTIATAEKIYTLANRFIGTAVEGTDTYLICEFPNMDYAWGFAKVAKEWEWDVSLHKPVSSFTEPVYVRVVLA